MKNWHFKSEGFLQNKKRYLSELCLLFCWQVGKGEKSWGFFAKLCQLLWLSGHQILFYLCGQLYREVKLQDSFQQYLHRIVFRFKNLRYGIDHSYLRLIRRASKWRSERRPIWYIWRGENYHEVFLPSELVWRKI